MLNAHRMNRREKTKMQTQSVKFFGKNVNDGKFADYRYIGSAGVTDMNREQMIRTAEAIGGPINGPLVAMVEGETDIRVLKV